MVGKWKFTFIAKEALYVLRTGVERDIADVHPFFTLPLSSRNPYYIFPYVTLGTQSASCFSTLAVNMQCST